LTGIGKYGHPATVVTSSFIADIVDHDACVGCGKCSKACPIHAIEMVRIENPKTKKKKEPVINKGICLGCGVCALNCETKGLQLIKRKQRVIHPENAFERIILQALERGTLQNQLFYDTGSITHNAMRGILGGFLRLDAVKKALVGDTLRSRFLNSLKTGARLQGRGWITEL
jgi:Pyruvate/2-oxoacid:ferredoxin oxidoreductase delta subunit